MNRLKNYCKMEFKATEKHFTIVQYDDGCLGKVQNCRVFSAGGVGDDPIPLVTDRHPLKGLKKKYFANFLGSVPTHPIRQEMMDIFKNEDMFWVENVYTKKLAIPRFAEITEESCFTLCPRGYGKTSFRLYEAMQLGSVPVYISDEHWLPFTDYLNWDKFCIVIKPEEMKYLPNKLKNLLASGEYKQMAEAAKRAYDEYFCYQSCLKTIKDILEKE